MATVAHLLQITIMRLQNLNKISLTRSPNWQVILLDGIFASSAFAPYAPMQGVALRLNSTMQSSNSIHLTTPSCLSKPITTFHHPIQHSFSIHLFTVFQHTGSLICMATLPRPTFTVHTCMHAFKIIV